MDELPKKEGKRSWKERQRERQIRWQKAHEAYEIQRVRAEEKKSRQRRRHRVLGIACLVATILVAYSVWEYYARLPPAISGGKPFSTVQKGSAINFSFRDTRGNQFALNQHSGKVIVVHFMAVGCYGQIYSINVERLNQLRVVCGSYCVKNSFTIVTVAVATCENSELEQIRAKYGISWILGNDYDDKKMDIVEAYVNACSIKDGTIVLIDKAFNIAEMYSEAVTVDKLSGKINQLLEA